MSSEAGIQNRVSYVDLNYGGTDDGLESSKALPWLNAFGVKARPVNGS